MLRHFQNTGITLCGLSKVPSIISLTSTLVHIQPVGGKKHGVAPWRILMGQTWGRNTQSFHYYYCWSSVQSSHLMQGRLSRKKKQQTWGTSSNLRHNSTLGWSANTSEIWGKRWKRWIGINCCLAAHLISMFWLPLRCYMMRVYLSKVGPLPFPSHDTSLGGGNPMQYIGTVQMLVKQFSDCILQTSRGPWDPFKGLKKSWTFL